MGLRTKKKTAYKRFMKVKENETASGKGRREMQRHGILHFQSTFGIVVSSSLVDLSQSMFMCWTFVAKINEANEDTENKT